MPITTTVLEPSARDIDEIPDGTHRIRAHNMLFSKTSGS